MVFFRWTEVTFRWRRNLKPASSSPSEGGGKVVPCEGRKWSLGKMGSPLFLFPSGNLLILSLQVFFSLGIKNRHQPFSLRADEPAHSDLLAACCRTSCECRDPNGPAEVEDQTQGPHWKEALVLSD